MISRVSDAPGPISEVWMVIGYSYVYSFYVCMRPGSLTARPWKCCHPKRNVTSLPSIHFQGRTVSFREGICKKINCTFGEIFSIYFEVARGRSHISNCWPFWKITRTKKRIHIPPGGRGTSSKSRLHFKWDMLLPWRLVSLTSSSHDPIFPCT